VLGVYTQADKWSKMSSASVSQILTATFVPLLSGVQDDAQTFRRYLKRVNRFTAFLLFPVMFGLTIIGAPLFHTLFGNKWDAAIPIFQILTLRGIFIVMISLYNNFILSIGAARKLFIVEIIKDVLIFVAILSTMWSGNLTLIVWGQFAASALTWMIVLRIASRATGYSAGSLLYDLLPSLGISLLMGVLAVIPLLLSIHPALKLIMMIAVGAVSYIALSRIFRIPEVSDVSSFLLRKLNKDRNRS
nr:oligosaccharide flippase family protein [Muribaculaceae bacterium]